MAAAAGIGEVDPTTVLKYPHTTEEMKWVLIEANILAILGSHPRVVQPKDLTSDGFSPGVCAQ
jgi:hypothetical protein